MKICNEEGWGESLNLQVILNLSDKGEKTLIVNINLPDISVTF